MVAVVTGSAGFIGRTLVEQLAERGPVVGIDRLTVADLPAGVTHITAELLDPRPDVAAAFASADIVFHLAGCGDVRDARPDADMHRFRDNGLAAAAVLAAAPAAVPVLVASSSSIYGGSVGGRPSAETDEPVPKGGYARSKVLVEQICAGRAAAGGRVAVFRPFTVAGEGQRPGMAFSRWIAAARRGEPLRMLGSPDRSRDITDVRQMAQALVDLGDVELAGGSVGTVNVGTGTGQRLGDLIAAVGRVLGMPLEIDEQPADVVEVEHTLADTTRLRSLIGWAPHTDLDALVARQVDATAPARV